MKKPAQKQKPLKPAAKQAAVEKQQNNPAWLPWVIIVVLMAVTFAAYLPMLSNEFTAWDDNDYVTENVYIKDMDAAKVQHILTTPVAYNYHPLTMLSLGINYYFSQFNPASYYITNLLLHLLNTALAFWFIYLLGNRNIHVASLAAAVFALHPMHVESVAWISERKDVLYAAFFLSSLISYLFYLQKKKYGYYFLSLILAVCSMASKPAAIILPAVFVLLDYYKAGKIARKNLLLQIPVIVFAAYFLYMTWIAQTHETNLMNELETDNHFDNFLYACYGFLIYIVKFFVPVHLAAFHPFPDKMEGLVYVSPFVIVGLCLAIYYFKAKRKLLIFGLAFFLVNLVMVLQVISIGSAMYAERYTYIPYLGLLFIAGMLLFNNTPDTMKKIAWVVIGCFLMSFTYMTSERVKVWHNAETLWTDEIEKYPENYKGYYGRGKYYSEREEFAKAIPDYTNSIKYKGDYRSYTNRAAAYTKLQMPDKAMDDLNTSIQMNATHPEAFINRAQLYKEQKRLEDAMKDINKAIEIEPKYEGYFTRASIYKEKGMYEKAIADYTMAATLTNEVSLYVNRGNVYFMMGAYEKAIGDYNIVLQQKPNDAKSLSNRASALYQLNRFNEARADLDRAITIEPNTARHYATRSSVYEKLGDKQKALLDAQAAIERGFNFPADVLARLKN